MPINSTCQQEHLRWFLRPTRDSMDRFCAIAMVPNPPRRYFRLAPGEAVGRVQEGFK
jgi:hypothetical protein